ncbi:hypothetical protein HanPI659440_Chr00c07g0717161 [Helianthus annuus]|nr:hypothetical protein HanPI659440_Chr00c07g0717161 [Helianthus annuus]
MINKVKKCLKNKTKGVGTLMLKGVIHCRMSTTIRGSYFILSFSSFWDVFGDVLSETLLKFYRSLKKLTIFLAKISYILVRLTHQYNLIGYLILGMLILVQKRPACGRHI